MSDDAKFCWLLTACAAGLFAVLMAVVVMGLVEALSHG